VQIACALLSTWGATSLLGCGDGIYTPGQVVKRDGSVSTGPSRDSSAPDGDAASAFVTTPDAAFPDATPDVAPPFNTKTVGFSGGSVSQGAATLVFPKQSFSPASDVTIREVTIDETGHRGPFSPVFELTFEGGKPLQKPSLTIRFSQIFDAKKNDVRDLASSLVLRRLQPESGQWVEMPNIVPIVDPLDPGLEGRPFDYLPDGTNRMYIGVLLSCGAPNQTCVPRTGMTCSEWCTSTSGLNMTCNFGQVCQ
jgi:hypothetical protein